MFRQEPVLQPQSVGGEPWARAGMTGEPPVHQDVVAFGQDEMIFISQGVRHRTDEAEQAVAPWRDVRAVLDVAFRPELRCPGVVAPVEQRVESFQHQRFGFSRRHASTLLLRCLQGEQYDRSS